MFYAANTFTLKADQGPSLVAPFHSRALLHQIDIIRLNLLDSHRWYIYLTIDCGMRAVSINADHLMGHESMVAKCRCPRETWLDVTWVHASRVDPTVEVLSCAQLLEAANDQSEEGQQLLAIRIAGAAKIAKMVAEAMRHS